jgi:hypothetical protein
LVDWFEFPKLRYEDVSLRLDLPSEPDGNGNGETGEHARTWSSVSFKLEEGLSFGGPMAAPLQKKDVHDDDLRTFMRDPAATWLLVHSGVTFKGEQKRAEFDRAMVAFRLAGAEALAWSLYPISAATPLELSSALTFEPNFQVAGTGGGLGSAGKSKKRQTQEPFILSQDAQTATPSWLFKRTSAVKLEGNYRLVMVVRGRPGEQAKLTTTLNAAVRPGRIAGLVKDRVDLLPYSPKAIELAFPSRS